MKNLRLLINNCVLLVALALPAAVKAQFSAPQSTGADAAAVPSGYQVLFQNEAGMKLVGHNGGATSLDAAIKQAARDFSHYFDKPPRRAGSVRNNTGHARSAVPFSAQLHGQRCVGVGIFSQCDNGGVDMVVMYAFASSPGSKWAEIITNRGPQNLSMAGSGPSSTVAVPTASYSAPAQSSGAGLPSVKTHANMTVYTLPDGSASVNVPAGWTATGSTLFDPIIIQGPAGQAVVINQNSLIYTPNSQNARLNAQAAKFHTKTMDITIAPYCDPTSAWNALLPQFNKRRQQNGGPVTTPIQMLAPPQSVGNSSTGGKLLTCTLYTLGPSALSGVPSGQGANVYYAFDRTDHGTTTHFRGRGRFETAVIDQDSWALFVNVIVAPDATFDQDQDLMQAVINSEKFNAQVAQDAVAKRTQEMSQARGQAAAATAAFNQNMARMARQQQVMINNFQQKEISTIQGVTAAGQLGVNRAVDDTSEFLRDPASTVVNTSTGEYFNTHMADAQAAADSLNAQQGGSDWQYVPLKDQLDPITGTRTY